MGTGSQSLWNSADDGIHDPARRPSSAQAPTTRYRGVELVGRFGSFLRWMVSYTKDATASTRAATNSSLDGTWTRIGRMRSPVLPQIQRQRRLRARSGYPGRMSEGKRRKQLRTSPGREAEDFPHPDAARATAALQAVPGIDTLVAKIMEYGFERMYYLENTASNVRVTPRMFERLHKSLGWGCKILGIDEP